MAAHLGLYEISESSFYSDILAEPPPLTSCIYVRYFYDDPIFFLGRLSSMLRLQPLRATCAHAERGDVEVITFDDPSFVDIKPCFQSIPLDIHMRHSDA